MPADRVLTAAVPASFGGQALTAARGAVQVVALRADLEVGKLVLSEEFTAADGQKMVAYTWKVRKRKRPIFEWNRDPKKVRRFES